MKILSRYIVSIFTVVCTISALPVEGQINAAFKHIKSENGLSSSNVKTIMQDSYGFMWFGTKNGLNRYDGTVIRQIDCDDKERRIGNHNIGALYEDKSHNIWVGTDRGIYIYNPGKDTFRYVDVRSRNGVKPENWVQEILSDCDGNIWALIPDQGVFRFAHGSVDFYSITDKKQFKQQSPVAICLSGRDVWVATSGVGIYRYDRGRNRFEQHLVDRKGVSLKGKMITSVCTLRDELILGMTNGELIRYDYRLNEFTPTRFAVSGRIDLRDIKAQGNEIWVGAQQGLYIYNYVTGATQTVKEDPMNPFSLSDNIIYYIYFDSRGGAWLGTMFGGVNYMPRNKFQFEKHLPSSRVGSLSSKRIRGIAEDGDGNVWIGTEDAGINILQPGNRIVRQIKVGAAEANKSVIMVKRSGDDMVLGFSKSGLMSINTKTGAKSMREWNLGEGHNGVYSFLHDSRGRDWIGLGWGLYRRENAHTPFERVNATGYDWIFDIAQDCAGCIWIATMGNGIWKYDIKKNTYKKYTCDTGRPNGLRSNSVSSIMQDRHGRVWFTTDRGGISCYCRAEDKFVTYGVAEGLPDDVAYNIVEDDAGNLWFGTNKGLVKFNPGNKSVRVFTTKDGLLGNQFNYGSAIRGSDGTFYFGGIDGLISFKPNLYNVRTAPEPVYITRVYIYNKAMDAGSEETLLNKNIVFADTLVLPYDKSNVAFDISSMSYLTSGDSRYSYMMAPIDNEWVKMNDDHHISYSNLPPGKYVLRIRAVCGGKERVKELVIIVLPPWWQTSWAYFGYVVLLIVALVMWFLWYRAAKERQLQEKQKLFTIKKEKELYESKVEFFTEIAHEIRTPLTLIDSPLEAVEEIGVSDSKVRKYLRIMRQNTKRLLDLSSQLLDFQKIDSRKLVLKNECVDVRQLLGEMVERFEPSFELQSKELITDISEDAIVAFVDKEAITKIISNLLNNALKYGKRTTIVNLLRDSESFILRVSSDGVKITGEQRRRIFEAFYQEAKNSPRGGVGIGLSLSRSLAELQGGSLNLVDDAADETNIFELVVPLRESSVAEAMPQQAALPDEEYVVEEAADSDAHELKFYTLLFVEDNDAMRDFISERLSEKFSVIKAENGKAALELLGANHVDLIVTDIVMPEMNGFDLCVAVKKDINLSHIPVVFLTAKNDIDSKVKGLKCGAEAYIEKPFSLKYFMQQIESLLDNRSREREAYSKNPFFTVSNMKTSKADEEFMNKVVKVIEDNMNDEKFNVETMMAILCMSRSSLMRKIKTLFNQSPLDLIRIVKLKKAAELIQEGHHRIGDVCYMVGINSPSYFSKLFYRQFGITPKNFEKQRQARGGDAGTDHDDTIQNK